MSKTEVMVSSKQGGDRVFMQDKKRIDLKQVENF